MDHQPRSAWPAPSQPPPTGRPIADRRRPTDRAVFGLVRFRSFSRKQRALAPHPFPPRASARSGAKRPDRAARRRAIRFAPARRATATRVQNPPAPSAVRRPVAPAFPLPIPRDCGVPSAAPGRWFAVGSAIGLADLAAICSAGNRRFGRVPLAPARVAMFVRNRAGFERPTIDHCRAQHAGKRFGKRRPAYHPPWSIAVGATTIYSACTARVMATYSRQSDSFTASRGQISKIF